LSTNRYNHEDAERVHGQSAPKNYGPALKRKSEVEGGTLAPGNKALACDRCNTDKGQPVAYVVALYRLEKANDPRAAIVAAANISAAGLSTISVALGSCFSADGDQDQFKPWEPDR
jgi:hypothetical protein